MFLHEKAEPLIEKSIPISEIKDDQLFNKVIKMKENIGNDEIDKFKDLQIEIKDYYSNLRAEYHD
jgi:V/A-type H+-transporting ATPase subunit A